MLDAAIDGTRVGVRNRAILAVLYRTGMRCKELCTLQLSDLTVLSEGNMIVRIRLPKGYQGGAMPREVGIDKRTSAMVNEWLAIRGTGDGPLFITRNGTCVSPAYLKQMIDLAARRAGVDRRVHPHAFRHTFAKELYDEGVKLMEIMLALGHVSLTTTQKYLQHIGATEVVNATKNRSW